MWAECKKEISMQYSVIPSDTHATLAFTNLEQGPDDLLDNYCVSKLLSKIYNTSDMSSIAVKATNHYAVAYGLNCRKLKDHIIGH